jgi:hypothetical protein
MSNIFLLTTHEEVSRSNLFWELKVCRKNKATRRHEKGTLQLFELLKQRKKIGKRMNEHLFTIEWDKDRDYKKKR